MYKQEHLTPEEFARYAPLGLVEGITEHAGKRCVGEIVTALVDRDEEAGRSAELEDELSTMEDDRDVWENLAEDAEANLRTVLRELHILFVRYPNLKNSMTDLHAAYLQMKGWEQYLQMKEWEQNV